MNKNMKIWLILGVVVLASVFWWWVSRSEIASAPTPMPAAQSDVDVQELNSINADANRDLDAEFQQIDQDLNNL